MYFDDVNEAYQWLLKYQKLDGIQPIGVYQGATVWKDHRNFEQTRVNGNGNGEG